MDNGHLKTLRTAAQQTILDDLGYYRNPRLEMFAFLPPQPQCLLDVGCAEGYFAAAVKSRFPQCETWGVELEGSAARRASTRVDHVINAPFDDTIDLPSHYFDVVTMNDVLEHIPWPEPALAAARHVLRPEGKLILSLPNVQHLFNVLDLVKRNDWEYRDHGVLDRTHFRFYTTKSASRLLGQNGFLVERIEGIWPCRLRWYYRFLFALAPKTFRWMPYAQFVVVARKG